MNRRWSPIFRSAWLWNVLLAGYWLGLVVGTHLPPTFKGIPRNHIDKVVHFAAYLGLAWLLAMVWETSTGRLNGRHLRVLWVAIALFGMVDEVTQQLVDRDATLGDWAADAAGAAVGLLVFRAWQRWVG